MLALLRAGRSSSLSEQAARRLRRACSARGVSVQPLASPSAEAVTPREAAAAGAAYVHLPFCRRRCFYCDFPIQVVGDNTGGEAVAAGMRAYVDALCADVSASAPGPPLSSVFFGGGTPSLLPPSQLARILASLRAKFGLAPGAEVSMECDPGTFTAASLAAYLELGVNRVNVGVQSFDAAMLAGCGRAHSVQDVAAALQLVRSSGVRSWGLDLISGLPNQTADVWRATLQACVEARPLHVSVYDLQVEKGTAFGRWYTPGALPLPSEGEAAEMYRAASHALVAAGYEHYEVSNFAMPGHRCGHNLRYWTNGSWHAFGVAAASHVAGRRYTRPRRLADYLAWVSAGCDEGPAGAAEGEEEQLFDELMLGLRLSDGLRVAGLRDRFGAAVALAVVRALAAEPAGLVRLGGAGGLELGLAEARAAPELVASARLTLDGWLLSNSVLSSVLARLPAR